MSVIASPAPTWNRGNLLHCAFYVLSLIIYLSHTLYEIAMPKNVLSVEWQAFSGAAHKRRMLHLKPNADGIYLCPVDNCLHVGFKSQRGLRKHIETRHSWYYYFDEQPKIMREEIIHQGRVKMKQTTHTVPAFSLEDGVGKLFLQWFCTFCGGGKSNKEAMQIGRRAMKFLMSSLGESEVERYVKEEYVDAVLDHHL